MPPTNASSLTYLGTLGGERPQPIPTRPLRVAIVGAGSIVSDIHLPAWRYLPGAQVVAICDSDDARAHQVARDANVPVAATSLARLADREIAFDAVAIATPPHTHEAIAAEALELGCHVLVEKPATLSAPACSSLCDVADAAHLQAWAVHSYRYRDPILKLRQAVRSGQLGQLEQITIRSHGDAAFRQRRTWNWSEAGDRLLIYELGIHYVDLAILFAGPVAEVTGLDSLRDWGGNVTAVFAVLRHISGTITVLDLRVDCSNRLVELNFGGSNHEAVVQLYPEHFALLRGQSSPITDLQSDFQRLARFAVGVARDQIRHRTVKRRAVPHQRLFSQFLTGVTGSPVTISSDLRSTIGTMKALDLLHKCVTDPGTGGSRPLRSLPR